MLRVDDGRDAAVALAFRDGMDGQGGLTAALRTVDLHHAAFGIAAHAEREVQSDGARGDHLHLLDGVIAHPHHRALAEGFLHLVHRQLQCLQLVLVDLGCHVIVLLWFRGKVLCVDRLRVTGYPVPGWSVGGLRVSIFSFQISAFPLLSSSTCAAWSFVRTSLMMRSMTPFPSIRKVVRRMPSYSRPMNFLRPHTP